MSAERSRRGYTSDFTGIVRSGSESAFAKAVRDPGRGVSSLEREAAVNPFVAHLSPALLWQARGNGWLVLGFEVVPFDHHASFKPGSPDLPAVLRAVDAIGRTPLPEVARDWHEHRYDRYAEDGEAQMFGGDVLLHTDINPDNLLVRDDGEVAVVDWSWPARGAAWLDPACLVVQLVSAGHSPGEAEGWVKQCAAWEEADPEAVGAFSRAVVRMYQRFAEMDPQPWRDAMTDAAREWAAYRKQAA